jgi:hypothetical protein
MPTAVKDTKATDVKIAFKRIGPSDYGLKLRHNGEIIDLRVTGTYVRGADASSTVHNAWVWTARLNGEIVESKETLLRKKDATELLIKELAKRGVKEFKPAVSTVPSSNGSAKSNTKVAQSLLKKADKTHPMFAPASPTAESEVDPILRTTVRIKGTTLVGVVIAKTSGDRERLRIEFPEGHKAWATREVVEEVPL